MLKEYLGCKALELVYYNLLSNVNDGEKYVFSDHIPATP